MREAATMCRDFLRSIATMIKDWKKHDLDGKEINKWTF